MTGVKPSDSEEKYFGKIELENKKRLADETRSKMAVSELEGLKKLHWMRCPKCGMELETIPYRGVEIDKCFHCEGVFLDKGELEKLAGEESGFLSGLASLFKS